MADATALDVIEGRAKFSAQFGDCVDWMMETWTARDNKAFADLVIADSPYNIGHAYTDGADDRRDDSVFLHWVHQWLGWCDRILKTTGSLWVFMANEYAAEIVVHAKQVRKLTLRDWVVWAYSFGPHLTTKFGRDHVNLLHFTKSKSGHTWNPDAVRIPSKRQACGDKRANPNGRVPGDVWQFPRMAGTFKRRAKGHSCQIPEEIYERIVLSCSNPDDLVVDPFLGSGGSGAVAVRLGRRFIGCDTNAEYVAAARDRIEKACPVEST